MSPPTGWVPTRLQAGDQLGSFPGNDVPASSSLARLYSSQLGGLRPTSSTLERQREEQRLAKLLVAGNGVAWSANAIDAWVLRTGGKRNALGTAVFTDASVIFLPAGGPRPPATTAPAVDVRKATGGLGVLVGLAVTAWWLTRG